MTLAGATAAPADPTHELLLETAAIAARLGREDLATRLEDAARRLARTETVVCVVGEFKQGKSALINGLLGTAICPVDDDLATTTVTVVRHGDVARAIVRRREAGELIEEAIPPDDVVGWVLERDGPADRTGVEVVEIALPHPFLARGMVLVDTPGVGGLNAGHAAATLAFLPSADALIFVTDASAELSAPELEFLTTALRAGRPVIVAITKVDMYPAWRRIVELDEEHLRAIGLTGDPIPLSAVLRLGSPAAGGDSDGAAAESGFGRLADLLAGEVAADARALTRAAATTELRPAVEQLREPLNAEAAALEDPGSAGRMATELRDVRARLAALDAADAAWSVRLEDEFAALRSRVAFGFQGRMRIVLRDAEDELEEIDPAQSWPELSGRVQEGTAAAVREAFGEATAGAASVQATIAAMLADEQLGLEGTGGQVAFDVRELWEGMPGFAGRTKSGVMAGLGVVTGAKVGVEMLGMLGTLLGAAIVGPAVLGVALAFGGKEVLSERRRQLADRRQQARTFLGDFVEEVRFQVDGRLATLLDEIQRQMRARFAERIRELRRTFGDSVAALERGAAEESAGRARRLTEIRSDLAELDRMRTAADEAGARV
jgi:GTP-binding protein EngB required for normal cell division